MDAPTRVMKAFNHEEPDRVPAFENAFDSKTIKNYFKVKMGGETAVKALQYIPFRSRLLRWIMGKRDFLAKSMLKDYKFYQRMKLDIGLSLTSILPKTIIKGGFIDEYGRIMKFEKYKGDETYILAYHGGHLKSFEDYESWDPLDAHEERRINGFLAGRDAQKELNNEIFSIPTAGALMECSWEGFGLEIFSRILGHPKQAKRIFDDRGKFTLEMVKILAENDAQVVLLFDDYGFKNGLFMSPRNYRTYIFPWLKQICEAAHKHDCKVWLHSCGDILDIFEDLINLGIDAFHPIEPSTANPKYDIFKLNEKYGDKVTFVGNIAPQMLSTGTLSEIEEYSKKLIRELAPGGGYIFSSGHSINPAITLDRWLTVLDIREKYGNYPIKIPENG